jgi:hypothetical protein
MSGGLIEFLLLDLGENDILGTVFVAMEKGVNGEALVGGSDADRRSDRDYSVKV